METPINKRFPLKHLNKEKIIEAKKNFIGTINQYPPIFSAIKKKGKRLYEFARIGKKIDIQSRKVVIYNLEFSKINLPDLNFKLKCSKGTYIRSLANDFGKSIDSGGYLSSLRRTAIGSFKIKNSIQLQEFIEKLKL